jgi:hypothetical protein
MEKKMKGHSFSIVKISLADGTFTEQQTNNYPSNEDLMKTEKNNSIITSEQKQKR